MHSWDLSLYKQEEKLRRNLQNKQAYLCMATSSIQVAKESHAYKMLCEDDPDPLKDEEMDMAQSKTHLENFFSKGSAPNAGEVRIPKTPLQSKRGEKTL
jgi:hypothetical protein